MRNHGMTLLELLVVLAILALMATVAVTSTDVLLSQGRYEATTRTLANIQDSVLGPPNARQADGTLISTGFVADLGGALVCTGTDSTGLSELWALPGGVAPFGLQATSDPDVVVPCGWRGPYLRLPAGQSGLLDGWGNPFDLLDSSGNPVPRAERSLRFKATVPAATGHTTRPSRSAFSRPRSRSPDMFMCRAPAEAFRTRPAAARST